MLKDPFNTRVSYFNFYHKINNLFTTFGWDVVDDLDEAKDVIVEQLHLDPYFPKRIKIFVQKWGRFEEQHQTGLSW